MDLGIKLSSIERSRHRRVLAFNLLQLILRPYRNADQSHEKTTTQKNRIRPIGTKPQLLLAASLLLLGICTMGTQYIPPTAQQFAVAGYGAPLTIDYKKAIEVLFFDKLKDPLSAQYVLAARPEPWRTIDYIGGTLHIGYAIRFQLNSKNSYGGYIGFRKWSIYGQRACRKPRFSLVESLPQHWLLQSGRIWTDSGSGPFKLGAQRREEPLPSPRRPCRS
jgi:hypothetical protein